LESKNFDEKRLQQITAALEAHPCVMITGKTGVGKSTFVEKTLLEKYRIHMGEERLAEWIEQGGVLFIDEANMAGNWSIFESLYTNNPGILFKGVSV